MTHDAARLLVERNFSGDVIAPLEAQAMRAHLRGCAPCRAHFDALAESEALLGPHAAAERMAREAESFSPRGRRQAAVAAVLAIGTLAAAGLVMVRWAPPAPSPADPDAVDLRARGGGSVGRQAGGGETTEPGKALAHVTLYRGATGAPQPLGDRLQPDDTLRCAYTNGLASPFAYLAVAARDAAGRVHWLWPTYETAGAPAWSLPIERGAADRALTTGVAFEPAGGKLEICAMFSASALSVPEVDAHLESGGGWPQTEGGAPVRRDCRVVEVGP